MADKIFYDAAYAVLALLLLSAIAQRFWKATPGTRQLTSAVALSAGAVSVLSMVVLAVIYLVSPHYSDLVQSQIVVISTNLLHGLPPFPDWRAGEGAYGSLYGPLVYELVAAPEKLAGTIWSTKLAAALAFLLTLPAMAYVGWKLERRAPPLITAFHIVAIGLFGYEAFWVRAEPFGLLLVSIACVGAASLEGLWAACVVGLAIGFEFCVKPHGVLYFTPILVYLLKDQRSLFTPFVWALAASACALLAIGLSFGWSAHSFASYLKYLSLATRHGFIARMVVKNLCTAVVLLWLLLLLAWRGWRGGGFGRRELIETAAVLGSAFVVAIVGSKAGSGSQHLLPFLPSLQLGALALANRAPAQAAAEPDQFAGPLLAIVLGTAVIIAVSVGFVTRPGFAHEPAAAIYADATRLSAKYPGAEFGPGDNSGDEFASYRIAPALRGASFRFDDTTWEDLRYGGVSTTQSPVPFDACNGRTWILPAAGEPFSRFGGYDARPEFSPAFQAAFKAEHRVVEQDRYFAVWSCSR